MTTNIYKKFILDLTDAELLSEVSTYFGHPVVYPKEKIGWITENPRVYTKDGTSVDSDSLIGLYNSNKYVKEYITVSTITSLRRRPADLFSLIRKQKSGSNVLEFGCGSSTHGIACAQLGCNVTIVDVSKGMLNWALHRYKSRGLNVSVHPVGKPLPTLFFDTIICSDVFEHLPNPANVLKQFLCAVKLGGMIHLHVSTAINLNKGHLPCAISSWRNKCVPILAKTCKKISKHNYKRVK